MGKIDEARELLKMLGMPKAQQADICCYVLLAMAGIKQDTLWKDARNEWIRIHDIIQFANTYYGSTYAENSRETFRKQALHHFRNAALVEDDNGKATNSPNLQAYRRNIANGEGILNLRMAKIYKSIFEVSRKVGGYLCLKKENDNDAGAYQRS